MTDTALTTLREGKGPHCAYWGERGEWLIGAAVHRDTDSVDRSNFRVMLRRLGGESATVVVERFSHFAVGWVDYLLIDPADTERLTLAESMRAKMDDYPILDESDFSDLEWSEYTEFAESELARYGDDWADVLRECEESENLCVGDDSSEWRCIEAAAKILKARD